MLFLYNKDLEIRMPRATSAFCSFGIDILGNYNIYFFCAVVLVVMVWLLLFTNGILLQNLHPSCQMRIDLPLSENSSAKNEANDWKLKQL